VPLVYTPGDNEWTNCHRVNNGVYDPLERLAAVPKTFFPRPGFTLGPPMRMDSQARMRAGIRQLTDTFQNARLPRDRAVVVMTQADMLDPTAASPAPSDYAAFTPLVKTLIEQANAFGGPVYLINAQDWLEATKTHYGSATPLVFERLPFVHPAF
jgi:hypothetical protein